MSTYSQIYIQIVFGVKYRKPLIDYSWENDLYKYITGIVTNYKQKLLAINGMPDHIHIFLSISPNCNISDLVREIKKSSNSYINENRLCKEKFRWQEGFGAFSYCKAKSKNVIKYIQNQKERHRFKSFEKEYCDLLVEYDIKVNANYFI